MNGLNHTSIFHGYYTGWWLGHPSEKYKFVTWDDEIPTNQYMGKKKWQPNHQPVYVIVLRSSVAGKWPIFLDKFAASEIAQG